MIMYIWSFGRRSRHKGNHSVIIALYIAMACTVKTSITISMTDSKAQWLVKPTSMKTINDTTFVKLTPHEHGFVKLVAGAQADSLKGLKYFSLTQCPGYKALLQLREQAQLNLASSRVRKLTTLFAETQPAQLKRSRRTKQELKASLGDSSALTIQLPAVGDKPSVAMAMLRPTRLSDDFWVPLNHEYIEHIIHFIREYGLDFEALTTRRAYGQSGVKGVWLQGGKFIVVHPVGTIKRTTTLHDLTIAIGASNGELDELADDEDGVGMDLNEVTDADTGDDPSEADDDQL